MSREPKKSKQEKCKKCGTILNAKGRCNDKTCPYSDHPQYKRGEVIKSVEGTATQAKPAKPAKAESTTGEAKKEKANVHKYVTEATQRCTLPTNLVDKLHKCLTKGEAKRMLKAFLQGNSV